MFRKTKSCFKLKKKEQQIYYLFILVNNLLTKLKYFYFIIFK